MSNHGGVLADLDELIARDEDKQDYCSETGPNDAMHRVVELIAIRAAVAELIEADKAYDVACTTEMMANVSQWSHTDRDATTSARRKAADRRRVALARMEPQS